MESILLVKRGFTLIEMMVVLAIIAVITSIALFGQQDFNRSLLLTDTAYSVALSARESQARGLSSRRYSESGQDVQNAGYGLNFDKNLPGQYIVFADTASTATALSNCPRGKSGTPEAKPGNCIYDSTGSPYPDGVVQTYTFNRGFTVYDFCGTQTGTTNTLCARTSTITGLNIVFVRPNTETVFTARTSNSSIALDNAKIYIQSQDGASQRGVCFTGAGQVSVAQGTCP